MRLDLASHARRLAGGALACALAGCLPAGDPPAGRHLVKDRTLSGVFLSPSEKEGVPSYVFAAGPVSHPDLPSPLDKRALVDVYAFPEEAPATTADGLAGIVPVIERMDIPGQDPTNHTIATDSLGRLLLVKWNHYQLEEATKDYPELWRHDTVSGAADSFGEIDLLHGSPAPGPAEQSPFFQSPRRTRFYTGYSGFGWVTGLERAQFIWQAHDPTFIDEDFYCAGLVTASSSSGSSGSNIIRVKPDAEPEALLSSTGWLGIEPVVGDLASQLVLSLFGEQGRLPYSMLDTRTLQTRLLPPERGQAEFVSASPNGHQLLFRTAIATKTSGEPADYRLFIFDWVTKSQVLITSDKIGKGISGASEWRPGTNELWFSTLPEGFGIWMPSGAVLLMAPSLYRYQPAVGQASAFTADGRHWFSQAGSPRATVYVGAAEDPVARLLALNPEGTDTNRYWQIEDGRLLVEAWPTFEQKRNDIYLVDPDAGTSRVLGSAGRVVAAGRQRALALLNWQVSRSTGELTLLDYASGRHTLIAPDVYAVAVDRGRSATVPPGTDALAPGTRVAFLSRNRLVSRDDGLWVAELP